MDFLIFRVGLLKIGHHFLEKMSKPRRRTMLVSTVQRAFGTVVVALRA